MDESLDKEYEGECGCGVKVQVQVPFYKDMGRYLECPAYCNGHIYLERVVKKVASSHGPTKRTGAQLRPK